MRKKSNIMAVVMTGVLAVLSMTGCGEAKNANPKPEDYIQLGQYKGLEYVRASGEVTEEEIQSEMEYLASSFASEETLTEGKVENGDTANIDYVGTLDGVAFEGGTANGYDLIIGSHNFIDGFEDGLIGVEIGDTVDLNLTFPENYSEDLAGKDVVFSVTVHSVRRSVIPEITDEFITEISQGQYTNVKDYKDALIEEMSAEKREYDESVIYASLLDMAVENATVIKDIPQDYIQSKVNQILLNMQDYANAYGVSINELINDYMQMTVEEYNAQAVEYAKKAAVESLVVMAIANAEGISVTDKDLEEAIEKNYEVYGFESAEEFKNTEDMEEFREYILTSKVEDFLFEAASIIEE